MTDLSRIFEVIQNDFNDLAVEARSSKNDGLAGQISGLFGSGQHKDVKASAEAAQVALRNIAKESNGRSACHSTSDLVDCVVLACGKTRALCNLALPILQKLLSNDLLSHTARKAAIGMLRQLSRSKAHDDEGTKLKLLQICLTILQMPNTVDDQDDTRQVLALCFHMLSSKNASTVVNTASATVRQAIALVFDNAPVTPPRPPLHFTARGDAAGPESADAPHSRRSSASGAATERVPVGAHAALQLLKELCLMARGHESQWLECRALSPTFVLDVVAEIARSQPKLFRNLPPFLDALREDVCGMLLFIVQSQLDADTEHVQVSLLRVALQCLSMTIIHYSYLLPTKTEQLVQLVLHGCNEATHLAQQVLCMHTLRTICYSAPVVHFLYTTFDMKLDYKLRAVSSIFNTAAEFVQAFLQAADNAQDAEAVQLLSTLWAQKMHNRQLSFEAELAAHASTGYGGMFIIMLAIDTITSLVHSISDIVDRSLRPAQSLASADSLHLPPSPQPIAAGDGAEQPAGRRTSTECSIAAATQAAVWQAIAPTNAQTAQLLVESVQKPVLQVLQQLLRAVSGEVLVVHLLRCFQEMAQVTGVLHMNGPMNLYLQALCSFTFRRKESLSPPASPRAESPHASQPAAPAELPAPRPRLRKKDGNVLSPKNVQALRTVFNVTHELAEELGPAWSIVLAALDDLDSLLCSPAATTQQVSAAASGSAAPNSDLQILSTAAEQLYVSSVHLSDSAVMQMLAALRTLNGRSPADGVQVGQARYFALERMASILIHNRPRLRMLWGTFFDHVRALALSPNSAARTAATRCLKHTCLSLLSTQALQSRASLDPAANLRSSSDSLPRGASSASHGSNERASPPANGETVRVQHRECLVLHALVELFNVQGVQADVRYAVVDAAHCVLQGHGDELTAGWSSLLTLLEDVACKERESARVVRLGHECIDLVLTDFLLSLPHKQLRRGLHVEVCFVKQCVEVNTCYSASLSLWRAADTIGRALRLKQSSTAPEGSSPRQLRSTPSGASTLLASTARSLFSTLTGVSIESSDETATAVEPPSGDLEENRGAAELSSPAGDDTIGRLSARLSQAACEDLLLFVIEGAQGIALEPRPEVRSSGIKLLFDVMTQHGSALSEQEAHLWQLAFPLLMEVVAYVQEPGDGTLSQTGDTLTIGSKASRAIPLQTHHSRDSASKQWLETLDKALQGWAAYLRVTLPALLHVPAFVNDWATLIRTLQELATMQHLPKNNSSKKVALASLSFFAVVVAPHAAQPSFPAPLWDRCWQALAACAEHMAQPSTTAHVSVRQHFLRVLALVYAHAKPRFSRAAYAATFRWITLFAASPVAESEPWPVGAVLSPVQAAAFELLPQLLPPASADGWGPVVECLCREMEPRMAPEEREAGARRVWLQEASAKLLWVVKASMPWQVRAQYFERCVRALMLAMALRWAPQAEWAAVGRAVVRDFCALVAVGLPSVHIARVNGQGDKQSAWDTLCGAFEAVLLRPEVCTPAASASGPSSDARGSASAPEPTPDSTNIQADQEAAPAGATRADAQSRAAESSDDAELEASVLDCLTDTVLAACSAASESVRRRLVAVLGRGCEWCGDAARPPGDRLSHMCLRKLFIICGRGVPSHGSVGLRGFDSPAMPASRRICQMGRQIALALCALLCTVAVALWRLLLLRKTRVQPRGAGSGTQEDSVLAVVKAALPELLRQCNRVLHEYAAACNIRCGPIRQSANGVHHGGIATPPPPLTDVVLCALEVLASLKLSRPVADAALPMDERIQSLLAYSRGGGHDRASSEGSRADGKEQSHLLFVYSAAAACVEAPEASVRAAIAKLVQSVGTILGLPGGPEGTAVAAA